MALAMKKTLTEGKRKKKVRTNVAFARGPIVNGFSTIEEASPVHCTPERVADFSLPLEALTYRPQPNEIVTAFKNGDKERKVYCNIRLEDAEVNGLEALRSEAAQEQAAFFPSVTAMAGRFMSRARGDPKKALKFMQATQQWRSQYFAKGPVTDSQVLEDLKLGIVYFCGRDKALRPAIVVRPKRIPQSWYKEKCIDRLMRLLIFCMEYFMRYMVVPGRIETLVLIVDLKGLGIREVPLGPLKDIYNIMSNHYLGRAFRFYVVNLSSALSMIAGMAKGLLTDRQKQKLHILDNMDELRSEFALHQLEKDLGGSRETIQEFFPFPLLPGPFEGGCASGPNSDAIPGMHAVLSASGCLGRIWDPRLSEEENTRLQFAPGSAELLARSGLPVPHDLPAEGEDGRTPKTCSVEIFAIPKADSIGNTSTCVATTAITTHSLDSSVWTVDDKELDMKKKTSGNMSVITRDDGECSDDCDDASFDDESEFEQEEDVVVRPASFWSCRPCTAGSSQTSSLCRAKAA